MLADKQAQADRDAALLAARELRRARKQKKSTNIMARHIEEREATKERILRERRELREQKMLRKIKSQQKWKRKMTQSPYTVNLVAEHERIEEEVNARLAEEHALERKFEKRRQQVKNDIILRALSEAQHLEQLREEKRLIAQEEKRLKALLDIERAKQKRKQDLMKARRAEKERLASKMRKRREERREEVEFLEMQERELLKEKLGLEEEDDYGIRVGVGVRGALGGRMGVGRVGR